MRLSKVARGYQEDLWRGGHAGSLELAFRNAGLRLELGDLHEEILKLWKGEFGTEAEFLVRARAVVARIRAVYAGWYASDYFPKDWV